MMHKPSDYAHSYGEPVPLHGKREGAPDALEPDPTPQDAPEQPKGELATFRLLYESKRICLFETRDGHLTAVDVNRLV